MMCGVTLLSLDTCAGFFKLKLNSNCVQGLDKEDQDRVMATAESQANDISTARQWLLSLS